jgi:hypothetical protein
LHVNWAIPCRYAEVNDNLVTIVGGGIDQMALPAFPGLAQVLLALQLCGSSEELTLEQPHAIRVIALDPGGNELSRVDSELRLPPPALEDWLAVVHLTTVIAFDAEAAGPYRIVASVDDSAPRDVPMHLALDPAVES